MKKFMKKTMLAMTLAFTMFCTSIIPAAAQEKSVTQSCIECGNIGLYRAVEYSNWVVTQKRPCAHGTHLYDVTSERHIYQVTRCTYCHHLEEQYEVKTEIKYECSNS